MKNKRCCSVEYILTKSVISSENSIIHSWISMLTGICGTTAGVAVLKVDGGVDMIRRKLLMLVFLAVALCVMSARIGAAAVITVDDSGGADYTTIQAVLDAKEGETIVGKGSEL